jgi:hypothetical protein
LSEQTSDSSAFLNAVCSTVNSIFSLYPYFPLIRMNCKRISEGSLYVSILARGPTAAESGPSGFDVRDKCTNVAG